MFLSWVWPRSVTARSSLALHLAIGVLGKADRAGRGDALQPRGDIDAVAHQVAVALLDDVAEMDADAELDAALRRHAGIALDHAVLHLDGAAHGVDHAAELDEAAVAGALDDATMMHGDRGIDQIAAQRPQPRQGAILVRAGEPAVADDVRRQDCSKLSGLAQAVLPYPAWHYRPTRAAPSQHGAIKRKGDSPSRGRMSGMGST